MRLHSSSWLLAALLTGLATGCIHVPTAMVIEPDRVSALTAGLIGCPAREITVGDFPAEVGFGTGPFTWSATCRGHRFQCSQGAGTNDDAHCTEELAPAKP
jgi:hypothetical protein